MCFFSAYVKVNKFQKKGGAGYVKVKLGGQSASTDFDRNGQFLNNTIGWQHYSAVFINMASKTSGLITPK
jgi:hypothetical protein